MKLLSPSCSNTNQFNIENTIIRVTNFIPSEKIPVRNAYICSTRCYCLCITSGKVKIMHFPQKPSGSFVSCTGTDLLLIQCASSIFFLYRNHILAFLVRRHQELDVVLGTKLCPVFRRQFGSWVGFTISRQSRFLSLYRCPPVVIHLNLEGADNCC